MNIFLGPKLDQIVARQMASGNFSSPDEVVAAALEMLDASYVAPEISRAQMQKEISKGLEDLKAGRYWEGSTKEFAARVKERARSRYSVD